MRILLDTHCWLWMQVAPERFSDATRAVLVNPDNQLLLSAASSWEIGIKWALGKLDLPIPPRDFIPERMRRQQVTGLAIDHHHALLASALPPHHRDPFDRLLIAQAQSEDLTLLTDDAQMEPYDGTDFLWAR